MKKKLFGIAFAALGLVAFTAVAANNNESTKANDGKKCEMQCKKQKCGKEGKECGGAKHHKAHNPFEGLNLTDSQKSQLEQLREKQRTAFKAKKMEGKAEKQMKKQTERADKQARIAERRAAKKQYLDEVKAIIGSENYIIFLENQVLDNSFGKKGHGAGHFGKGKKDGCHGDKKCHGDMKKGHSDKSKK